VLSNSLSFSPSLNARDHVPNSYKNKLLCKLQWSMTFPNCVNCYSLLGSTVLQEPWPLLQQMTVLHYHLSLASTSSVSTVANHSLHLPARYLNVGHPTFLITFGLRLFLIMFLPAPCWFILTTCNKHFNLSSPIILPYTEGIRESTVVVKRIDFKAVTNLQFSGITDTKSNF
jgi:hypothetical protein